MTSQLHDVSPGRDDLVVETQGLTKRFGDRTAVDSVELQVPPGVAFLAERGRAAARVVRAAVRAVDAELARNLSARDLAGLHKGLALLAGLDLERRP
jgi:hypothetical protein